MNRRRPRVLFLTRYCVLGASSRYRVYQYLPALEEMGFQCDVQPFIDERLYKIGFQSGSTIPKICLTLLATARRIIALTRIRQFDIVYMQRELFPFGPPVAERWLRSQSIKLVFDIDDALFIGKPSRYNRLATWFRRPGKTEQIFTIAQLVLTGNDWLTDQARALGANAETFEVAEDVKRFLPKVFNRGATHITIGWLGSTSTVKYLRTIQTELAAISARFPNVQFELVGGGEFQMRGVAWKQTEWTIQEEVFALARFDIGLMPLPNEDWAKGKSGGKARTYMAAGVVPVCSSIGYNKQLIQDGLTGFLCHTSEDWIDALETLINVPQRREQMSVRARSDVEKRFSVARQTSTLAAHLDALAGFD